ncbi:Os06g0647150, partial [Oryza sativa Japonica Group]
MSSRSLKPSMSSMCTSLITRSKSPGLSRSIRSAVAASLVINSRWYLHRRSNASRSMRQTGLSSTASTRKPSGNFLAAVACVAAMFVP